MAKKTNESSEPTLTELFELGKVPAKNQTRSGWKLPDEFKELIRKTLASSGDELGWDADIFMKMIGKTKEWLHQGRKGSRISHLRTEIADQFDGEFRLYTARRCQELGILKI